MDQFCTCGHTEGWHTIPTHVTHLEVWARAVTWLPIPGAICEVCDECTGFVAKRGPFL